MVLYLILVCVASAIIPFLSGRIHWETMSKSEVVLAMGRAIRRYQQTGSRDSLKMAQSLAYKFQQMGGNLSPATIAILNGE